MPEPTPINNLDTKDIIIIAGAAGAIIAACISATFLLLNGWRQRIADAKRHKADTVAASERHFRELALQAALAQRASQIEDLRRWQALFPADQEREDTPEVDHLNVLLVDWLAVMQQFGDGHLSADELSKRIERYSSISRSLRRD